MATEESDDLPASSGWRDHHHEAWLTMQTAHSEYRRASEILGLLMAELGNAGSTGGGRELELARDEQRAAFENYVDSRLRFAELLQERTREQVPIHPTVRRFPLAWLVLTAVASALLGSLASFLIPSLEIGEVKSERDRLSADLGTSRTQLDALALRMSLVEKSLVPARSQPARRPGISRQHPPLRVRRSGTKPLPITFNPPHQEFTVKASSAFTRIGTISLSVRRLDTKRGDFNLYYSVRGSPVRELHLKVYQPVRIAPSDPGGSIELVVNRIAADQVHGYISVPRRSEPVLESKISGHPRLAISQRSMPTACLMDFK